MTFRKTTLYKKLDTYAACELVEWSETATEQEQLIAWQWLHDKRIAYGLQGWYGRNASRLVEAGYIER